MANGNHTSELLLSHILYILPGPSMGFGEDGGWTWEPMFNFLINCSQAQTNFSPFAARLARYFVYLPGGQMHTMWN